MSIKKLFDPERVVLIGSNSLQERVGMTSPYLFGNVASNMRRFYRGKTRVIDVDLIGKMKKANGKAEPSDLAVIMLPPADSIKHVEECARNGAGVIVLITGGYNESQRKRLLSVKQEFGIRILGPNTIMGVLNTANGLNTTFEKGLMPEKGDVAIVSQSGGVGACLLDWASYYDIGISKAAFVGDKIDIDDVELLEYLGLDQRTRVICFYIEGIKSGRQFIEQARKVTKLKPILALKGGVAKESARRAKSHTASIAGSDQIFDAAMKKAGIIRVSTIEELMNGALALSKQSPMEGDNVAVLSNVGGPAILAGDSILKCNLKLARLSGAVKTKIETLYPGIDASNPIDLIADARADRYERVLKLIINDANVDGVLVINMLKSTFFRPSDAKVVAEISAKHPRKPIVDVPMGGEDFGKVHKLLGRSCVPLYNLPNKAVQALCVLREYGRILQKH
jgi:acyl-CoA synthetase (NDP forming)